MAAAFTINCTNRPPFDEDSLVKVTDSERKKISIYSGVLVRHSLTVVAHHEEPKAGWKNRDPLPSLYRISVDLVMLHFRWSFAIKSNIERNRRTGTHR